MELLLDSTPYGQFGGVEGYHVATDVFYYGFVVQCRICVRDTPDSDIFVWRDLDEIARRSLVMYLKLQYYQMQPIYQIENLIKLVQI